LKLTVDAYQEDRATANRMLRKLLASAGKQGVYYVVRFPTRWRLYSFAWEDFGDLWHGDVWRKYVADDLASAWMGIAHVTAEELKPWWNGFPRGRVKRGGVMEYTVFHGNDFAATGIAPHRIETAFELGNSSVLWSFDPLEEQNPEHQAALLRLLPVQI
jgi:hypothetical protein